MSKFLVKGGAALYGSVNISGSKNAALPVLFASLTMKRGSIIKNLPDIGDIRDTIAILESLGAVVNFTGNTAYINTENVKYSDSYIEYARKIRASTYLIGAGLSRFGKAMLLDFGGCKFSPRPIDIHLDAAAAFGARQEGSFLFSDKLTACELALRKSSVGATVNSLILAANAKGKSVVRGVAKEPHIDTLIDFLSSAGAKISKQEDSLTVEGGELSFAEVTIPTDMIEAGTYLTASLITNGDIKVRGVNTEELSSLIKAFSSCGIEVNVSGKDISVKGRPRRKINIETAPYPGFPTDLQPIISTLMAYGEGGSILERVWEGRFGYLSTLKQQGVCYRIVGNRAEIFPSEFFPSRVSACDLRGGAASLLVSLAVDGVSEIDKAELILRGYDSPAEKLNKLGADIEIIEC